MPRGDDAEEAVENFKKLAAYRRLGVELTRTLAREAQDPEVKAAIKKGSGAPACMRWTKRRLPRIT